MITVRPIDAVFLWLRSKPFFHRFTWFTRFLLMAAFLPTGWVKLMGRRFTTIGVDSPIGAFFEALYQTGWFWRFIGLSQILAALLLIIPAWAHLGTAMFLPIILNIFVITLALQFTGTPVITGLMLLAVLYLVLWDFHRFRGLFFPDALNFESHLLHHRLDPWEKFGFGMFAGGLLLTFLGTRTIFPPGLIAVPIAFGFIGGLLALGRFLTHTRKQAMGG